MNGLWKNSTFCLYWHLEQHPHTRDMHATNHLPSRSGLDLYPYTILDERDQLFHVSEIIIFPDKTATMVQHTILFIPLQTVEKHFLAVPSGEQRETVWLDLREQSFSATFQIRAEMAAGQTSVVQAGKVLATVLVRTPFPVTTGTMVVLCAQTAGKTAPRNLQFPFHQTILTAVRNAPARMAHRLRRCPS